MDDGGGGVGSESCMYSMIVSGYEYDTRGKYRCTEVPKYSSTAVEQ